ncbi:MAG: protein translocase subunit SecD [Pseudomonadota bacterium]
MPTIWKWKVALFAFLTIVAIYLVAPTFLGFKEQYEAALDAQKPVPWYIEAFPSKWINLGLDLRGGIYLEFDVELSKAVQNKVDLIAEDLERSLKKEGVTILAIKQDTADNTILIQTSNAQQITKILEYVKQNYGETLAQKGLNSNGQFEVVLGFTDQYRKYLRSQISRQALEKVRNRIDRYGVAEPSIQRLGSDRIAVELPGVKDPERAIKIIKQAGQLEFKLVDDSLSTASLEALISEVRKTDNLADDYSLKTLTQLNEQLKGKIPEDDEIAFELKFDPVTKKVTGGIPYLLKRKAVVTGEMLKNTQVNVQNNEPYVSLTFDPAGTTKFGEATQKNVGKRLAILLDGVVTKAPSIREPILGGQAQITLGFGNYGDLLKEAEDLSLVLQEGALPAQLVEATKTIIGPSLGADSIHKGILATVIGVAIVIIFMLIYYKFSGLLANLALIFNTLFLFAALTLFQATLTLPGIAGIALSFAMAVDANVLIFERIKEELALGKTIRTAVEAGYSNAMRAIIDSNLTTLIAGIVLYQFGSGPIRGFAVTLIIGIAVSMYTAIVCTRMAFDYLLLKRKVQHISV